MGTLSMNTSSLLDRWRIAPEEIRSELARGRKPDEFVCLGCAAKVELVSTVYPVLEQLSQFLAGETKITLQPRDDVYLFETDGTIEVQRSRYAVKDLVAGQTASVTEDIRRYRPSGIVVLANFLPFPSQDKLKKALFAYYRAAAKADHPFTVGKGHTIQIAKREDEEYMIVDYVRSRGHKFYGVANNDTISNIDPNLVYSSWIGLFVAMNNALNDLFLSGVYQKLKIYPTVDARDPSDLPAIQEGLKKYLQRFRDMDLEVVDCGPLGFRTKSMGATVMGVTDREVPVNQRLLPGQLLIATRPVGDLAPLTEFLIRQSLDEDVSDLQDLRFHALEQMLIPNVEAAKVIARYLPLKGEPFDRARHITACRDMSGPGILAVEELAQDSRTDIRLDDIKFHDEMAARVDMPNPTSGTNGAIIICADEPVVRNVTADLRRVGYDPWVIGRVEGKSAGKPQIRINPALSRYPFIKGIHKGIFENYTFINS